MRENIHDWLFKQSDELKQEIQDLKQYINRPMTIKELEEFDNKFINNSPVGVEQ